jgi:hypothetical protein
MGGYKRGHAPGGGGAGCDNGTRMGNAGGGSKGGGRGHRGGDRETFLSLADVNRAIVQRFALCWWSCSVSALRTLTTHAGATERSVHTKLT